MSGRLLRKVLKEQELNQKQADPGIKQDQQDQIVDDESDSDGDSQNPFDLLNASNDGQNIDKDDEARNADGAFGEKNYRVGYPATDSAVSAGPSSYKKSNKKKKKKKNKAATFPATNRAENSLDALLERFSFDGDSANHQACSSKSGISDYSVGDNLIKQRQSSLLKVDPKFLNAENELRRIFGSKIVNSFENISQAGGSRHVRGARRGGHSHRKSILVSPSEHWPRWDGSLSMELLETNDGSHYFRYVHSSSYSQVQRAFEAAKAIHDLNGVASILMHHPYHVDSLMTLADYFKFTGEHQMAADAIAKCLYALECAWHPSFTPLQGNCRLEYRHDTNRPLFLTLFTHMKNLDRRGCHRSALEVCKLLLSLDSADPMGALFCIDYFSLRAEEYAWLEQFSEEYQNDNYLWHLPNFAYSLAICRFYLEHKESCPGGDLEHGKAASVDLMKQALMLHPSVLKKLVAKVPLKDLAWTNVLKHSFFRSEDTGIPSLDHLIKIYVERSYLVWRLPDLQRLLRVVALMVIQMLKQDASEASTWACARKEAFPSDKNQYKHLLVSDFSDAMPTMPPDNLQNFMVDPGMREIMQNQNLGPNRRAPAPRDLANRSPLAVLFESMLPWAHYGSNEAEADNQPNGHHQDNDHH
ncbi:hypothetical protein Nepgr_004670 [Nepenthes gracilis]|uniref:Transcription factor 25 n=1 Tax=Nepenthes gracilis TaxID=150966 RepID=A0AAD3S1T2_NEPGR|nr:hypothetical protein Nepgr_004670 [Nepenthes gracilis]